MAFTHVSAWLSSSTGSNIRRSKVAAATWWVKSVHLQTALVSAAAHIYVVYKVFAADNTNAESVNLARMYLPLPPDGPVGLEGDEVVARGSWLFLQFDHVFISLSSLSWVLVLLERTPLKEKVGRGGLLLGLLVAGVLLGPGAAVSLALYFREGYLAGEVKE